MPRYLLRSFTAALLFLTAAAGATAPAAQQSGALLSHTHNTCAPAAWPLEMGERVIEGEGRETATAVGKLLLTGLALLCCALALLALRGICSMRCGTKEASPADQPLSASSTT